MPNAPEIHGQADPRFERVREAFAENFREAGEVGAAVSVVMRGRPVVDLWAGHADAKRTRPWPRDGLVNVYSTTKGMTALCAHRLVDQGALDLDAPVARYWPEFAQAGKERIPVRMLLNHQAGLPAVAKPLAPQALYEWDTMTAALAGQAPWWEPGTRHGYHAMTFGWLVGEVIRRVSGKTPGRLLRDEVAGPLGADVFIGSGPENDARTAELLAPPPPQPGDRHLFLELAKNMGSVAAKAFFNPPVLPHMPNTAEWRRAEIPAANAQASARGLATIYDAAATGGLLSKASLEAAAHPESEGEDLVLLGMHTRSGPGFMLGTPAEPLGPNRAAFGHSGAGGSLAFCDPAAGLGFGYVMNQMQVGLYLIGPRAMRLVRALYACL